MDLHLINRVVLTSPAATAKSLQSCPTVRPHRRQPTRLPHPWDFPGKNTGVGCHFLLQCMKVKIESESLSRIRLLATPWTAAYQAPPSMGFSRQEYWSGEPLPSPLTSPDSHYYYYLKKSYSLNAFLNLNALISDCIISKLIDI